MTDAEKLPSWRESESQKANNGSPRKQKKEKKSSFCNTHGLMWPQKLRVGQEVSKKKKPCCFTWKCCERWLRLACRVHRTCIFRVTHDSRQSTGCDFQTSRLQKTSKWCNIGPHTSGNGRRAKVIGTTWVGVRNNLDSSTTIPPP